MRRIPAIAVAVLLLAGAAGCSSPGGGTSGNSTSANSASGYVGSWVAKTPAQAGLTLNADGTLTGNDGCNTLSGTWTATKKSAEFGPLASTQKACAGVNTWLSKATEARQDGLTLNIYDGAGDTIGVLDKKTGQ